MKKVLIAVIAVAFMLGVSLTGIAQETMEETVQGDSYEDFTDEVMAMDDPAYEEIAEEPIMEDEIVEAQVMDDEVTDDLLNEDGTDDTLYTYGNVVSAGNGSIVVLEYDFENDQDIEIGYAVNDQTVFQNLNGLEEIQAGDEVEIMYEEAEEQRVAKMVAKTAKN